MRVLLSLTTLASGLAVAAGCLGPRRQEYRSEAPLAVSESTPQADRLWEAIAETLREHRFRLDRVDRAAGVITTFPVGSEHFFEFWRHDVDTRPDFVESTLNPIRRRVEVSVAAADDGQWHQLSFAVHKERLTAPDRQFNSSGAVYQFFNQTLPTTAGERAGGDPGEVWIDLGRDPAMEERLLARTLARAGMTAVSEG
jgi:hypothetical protein